jgi:hypothetical protein
LRPSPQMIAYLEELAHQGIIGKTPTEVAEGLISREIERLIREKYLKRPRGSRAMAAASVRPHVL